MFKRDRHNCYHCYNQHQHHCKQSILLQFHQIIKCAKFTIRMPCIFLKPEPSTEVSAETVKTTEALEGGFPYFCFHFVGTVTLGSICILFSMFKVWYWERPEQLPSLSPARFSYWLFSAALPSSAAEGELSEF